MKHLVVALASALALVAGGPAASAVVPGSGLSPGVPAVSFPSDPTPLDPLAGVRGILGSVLEGVLAPPGPGTASPASPKEPEAEPTAGDPIPLDHAEGTGEAATWRLAARTPFPGLPANAYAGYGTGTAYHADAALNGQNRLTNIEVAFAGATYSSAPVPALSDELRRSVAPALTGGSGFGRGRAVRISPPSDLGLGEQDLGIDDESEAKAPPTGQPVSKRLTTADLSPLVDADLLRTRASARAAATGCVIGSDLAYGLGVADNTKIVKRGAEAPVLSLSADDPPRAVTQSVARTRLVPPAPGSGSARFGLVSEVRQTIAPITVLKGTPQEFTVEVGGEWVLRAFTDGTKGSITYGPKMDSSHTPLLRVTTKDGTSNEFDLQDLFGPGGADLTIPDVAEIIVGEDIRAIGGDADSKPVAAGTLVAGAADVVRVRLISSDAGVAEQRVGHMEASVAVPSGGISCPGIGMKKESDPPTVKPGDRFAWMITVSNPNDCLLDKVNVIDTVTTTPGVRYKVLSPLAFEGLGPLRLGESKTVRIEVEVEDNSPPGRFTDEAGATGTCGGTPVAGEAEATTGVAAPVHVPMAGIVALDAPEVTPAPVVLLAAPVPALLPRPAEVSSHRLVAAPRRSQGLLPRTGGLGPALPAACLLLAGGGLRRLRRRL